MRILVATLRYPPYVAGGYELITRDAVEDLRARGHAVTILSGRGAELEDRSDVLPWLQPRIDGDRDLFALSHHGSNLDRFRLHFLSLANLSATRRAIARTRPDVLFFFNLGLVSLAPILAARFAGVPTLGFAGDAWLGNHWLRDWRSQLGERSELRHDVLARFWQAFRDLVGVGDVLACSAHLAATLVDSGLRRESVGVAHHGTPPDLEALAEHVAPPQRASGAPLVVVCLSSFWEGKGQHVLLEAVRRARASGAAVELVFAGAGSGDYHARLLAAANAPELAGAVRFPGGLSREDVSRLLARSHVFCMPSLWGEPFGLATIEAMAHGVATVVTDRGASPEIVTHGVDGVVVPADDPEALAEALQRLEADEAVRQRLGCAARETARTRFTQRAFVDRLEEGLARVCPGAA